MKSRRGLLHEGQPLSRASYCLKNPRLTVLLSRRASRTQKISSEVQRRRYRDNVELNHAHLEQDSLTALQITVICQNNYIFLFKHKKPRRYMNIELLLTTP